MAVKFVNGEALTMTSAEEAALKADHDAAKVKIDAAAAAATKRANDTASAKTKLKELGLTDDELTAILGI
mgnify:CR=1 FL=1|tara:strand:+ start:356 stop:565 length:210 start_codon:yes stop_codon:yes gene_type:complete